MKSIKPDHCLNCHAVFTADPRNARHQKYCAAPGCRHASKAASQAAWSAKVENVHYHRGPVAVARVRAWQNDRKSSTNPTLPNPKTNQHTLTFQDKSEWRCKSENGLRI